MCCGCTCSDLILYVLGFLIPPVAVLLRSGFFSLDLLLNIVLTCIGVLPGIVHAFYYVHITSPLRRYDRYPYEGTVDWYTNVHRQRLQSQQEGRALRQEGWGGHGQGGSDPAGANEHTQYGSDGKHPSGAPPPYSEPV
ncbi:AaceriACL024Wp [[Ashbya] aceris (nom. inval.)]|nr:AaceriACL024Wp [[Ashbya] aceris (nom. inval.)]